MVFVVGFYLYTKIMQGESRKSSLLELYAEPQLILYKDTITRCIAQKIV